MGNTVNGIMNQQNSETARYDLVIVGEGWPDWQRPVSEESHSLRIAVVSPGPGASNYISGLNAVATPNPHGDTTEQYVQDMLQLGEHLGMVTPRILGC